MLLSEFCLRGPCWTHIVCQWHYKTAVINSRELKKLFDQVQRYEAAASDTRVWKGACMITLIVVSNSAIVGFA